MASITLAQYKNFTHHTLVRALIDGVAGRAPIYRFMPVQGVEGLQVETNVVTAHGGVAWGALAGGTVASGTKAAPTTANNTVEVAHLYGHIEIGDALGLDSEVVRGQLMERGMAIGKEWAKQFTEGAGTSNVISGLKTAVSTATPDQHIEGGTNGDTLTLSILRELGAKVAEVDGFGPDFFMMHPTHILKLQSLLDAAGGSSSDHIRQLPASYIPDNRAMFGDQMNGEMDGNQSVLTFDGAIIIPSSYIANETKGSGTVKSIFAGKWDDGSMTKGIAGIYPNQLPTPFMIDTGGLDPSNTFKFWRASLFLGLAVFNPFSLAERADVLLT